MRLRAAAVLVTTLLVVSVATADPSAINAAGRHATSLVTLRYTGAATDVSDTGEAVATGCVVGVQPGRTDIVTSLYGLSREPDAILVQASAEPRRPGVLVARDFTLGIALIRVAGEVDGVVPFPDTEFETPRPAMTTIVLGRSLGEVNTSVGVVSAVRGNGRLLQTDASISPLNYGGLLAGLRGDVLGIVVARGASGMDACSLYDSGIGFAVAWPTVKRRLARLQPGEDIHPGELGATFSSIDPLRQPGVIDAVAAGGPAQAVGMRQGDTIIAVGAERMTTFRLRRWFELTDAGQVVSLTYRRGEEERTADVRLARRRSRDQ